MSYKIIKRYGHEEGLSCCFRQWRAPETHCSYMHGYALAIELEFEGQTLDHRNWLISFGELKEIKTWLKEMFDHKTIISVKDPALASFYELHEKGLIQLRLLDEVGCEAFAETIYIYVSKWLRRQENSNGVVLTSVKVQEHAGNTAIYYGNNS